MPTAELYVNDIWGSISVPTVAIAPSLPTAFTVSPSAKYACKPTTGRFVFQTLSGIATEAAIEPSNRTRWSSATVPSELRVVAVSTTGAVAGGVGLGGTAPS